MPNVEVLEMAVEQGFAVSQLEEIKPDGGEHL